MSAKFRTIVAYGVFTDYVSGEKLERFEDFQGKNNKGICIISDGMSGEYTFWGYLLAMSEPNMPIDGRTLVGSHGSLTAAKKEFGGHDWAKEIGTMQQSVGATNHSPLGVYVWTHWS